MTDEATLTKELGEAQTIDDLLEIAKKAGHPLEYEQADLFFGRLEQAKSDTAELAGDSVAKMAKELLTL